LLYITHLTYIAKSKREREIMEKNDGGTMENNKKAVTTDETKINYRGWKSMPFIIGE
jgi:hypothetical protein